MSRTSADNRDRRPRKNPTNNNIQRNRGMPRNASMPPHMENVKLQTRDLYSNPRFCDVFSRLKGCLVYVQVKSGITHEGILHTISQKGEVVLIEASTKDQSSISGNMTNTLPKLNLKSSSIVKITAKDVDLEYPVKTESFATDSEISQRLNGQLPDRKLEEWCPEDESIDEKLLDSALESDVNLSLTKGNGWDANEMFLYNQRKFGYTSTYKEDLKEYTTPLDHEDTKEFRERKARAERLAKEIEQSPDHAIRGQIENNDEMTEEERFSSVSRVGPAAGSNARSEPLASSNNPNRYVPPHARQGGMGAPTFPRSGSQQQRASPQRIQNSGPGRPPMMPGDRQPPPQGLSQPFRHPQQQQQQSPKQQLSQHQQPPPPIHSNPPSAGHVGGVANDYSSRVQAPPPHHQHHQHQQSQLPPRHLNQQGYPQRPPMIPDRVSPMKGGSPTMSPSSAMGPPGQKPFIPNHDQQQQSRVPMMTEKPPAPSPTEAGIQRPNMVGHQGMAHPQLQQQQHQLPPAPLTSEAEKSSRTKEIEELKQFGENLTLKPDVSRENKVPAGPPPPHPGGDAKAPSEVIPPQQQQLSLPPSGPVAQVEALPATSQQPETKVASTSPVSQTQPKRIESRPSPERMGAEKAQSPEKPQQETKLNPNAKEFVPRVLPQKTPTPPPSRSPTQISASHIPMPHPAPYMTPQLIYGNNGQYLVTSNAPAGLQHYQHIPKQLQTRGGPRAEYLPNPYAAAGQPLVAPGQIITVTTGGQNQGGHLKMLQPALNHPHMIKQPMGPYRAMQTNPAVQAMHPQSHQMVPSSDGAMMTSMMAYQSQAAAAQSQSLQQQAQGPAPPNHYIHGGQPPNNAPPGQMQQHHTTPPLQQSAQAQGGNHTVMGSQGQFPQHGGRPSPSPMQQQQMAHAAQAQGQVVHQPQGGLPQLVAVSQGGQQAIVYTTLQQNQHGHGMPNQHAGQQYGNLQQHINQPNVQVQPTHVPSNMANITNVTRVHPEPHPHPHPAAPVYINQPGISNQPTMVQHPVTYMPPHAYNQTGN